jgi:hypothetical protein
LTVFSLLNFAKTSASTHTPRVRQA